MDRTGAREGTGNPAAQKTQILKMKTVDNERRDLPSASAMGRLVNCPGSFQLSRITRPLPVDEIAEAGTRIAGFIECIATGKGEEIPSSANEEEVETARYLVAKKARLFAQICEKNGYNPDDFQVWHENRLWYFYRGNPLFSGRMDTMAIHRNRPVVIVLDDKSGWKEQPNPSENWQLRGYSLLVLQNYEDLTGNPPAMEIEFHVSTVSRFHDEPSVLRLRHENPEQSLNEIAKTITHNLTLAIYSRPYEAGLSPGEWCRYCPARLACPAIAHLQGNLVETAESSPALVVGLSTPKLEALLNACQVVDGLKFAAITEARARFAQSPESFAEWEFVTGSPRRNIKDLGRLVEIVQNLGVPLEEIIRAMRADALSVSKTGKLVHAIRDRAKAQGRHLTMAESDKILMAAVGDLVELKSGEPTLKRK